MCFGAYWHLKLFIASLGYFGVGEPEGTGESPVALRLWHRPCIVMVLSEQVQPLQFRGRYAIQTGADHVRRAFQVSSGRTFSVARWVQLGGFCAARVVFSGSLASRK